MTRVCAVVGTLALLCTLASPAQAVPITEQTLIATGGEVVVTFVSNGAGYTSELFLDGSYGDGLGAIFNNSTTSAGATMNLGTFVVGTELVFKLLVQQTGDIFYTGPGSQNLDGVLHAMMQQVEGRVLVGFEDLFGGGDFDYNDLVFAFTNVSPTDEPAVGPTTGTTTGAPGSGQGSGGGIAAGGVSEVDEPGSLLMFGFGLAALVFVMKRQPARR